MSFDLIPNCDAISIFLEWTTTTTTTHARELFVSNFKFLKWTFSDYNFILVIFLKQTRTAMNGLNEKTPEAHEFRRKVRLQKQREQSRARLACETKEQLERRLHFRREARKGGEQSRRAETSQEAQKRLKAEWQRDVSRRQYQTVEQRARRLLDQSEGNARRHENETTTTTQPETYKST